MNCIACKRDMHPFQVLVMGRGMVSRCPYDSCGAEIPEEALDDAEVAAPASAATPIAPAAPSADEPLDVLDLARKRLLFLDERIVQLRAYEREHAKLERMLAAADAADDAPPRPSLAVVKTA